MSDRTKRGSRLLTCGAIVAVCLGVAALSAFVWLRSFQWRLDARLAAIRAAGDPATAEDLVPRGLTDETNAAVVLDSAAKEFAAFDAAYAALDKTPLGERLKNDAAPTRLTPAEADELARVLEPHGVAMSAADLAAACDTYVSTIDFTAANQATLQQRMLVNVQNRRSAGRLNSLRVRVLLSQGHREEAAEVALGSLRLSRLVRQEPSLVAMLVGVALHGMAAEELNRVLRDGDVSADFRERLDAELALNDDPTERVRMLKQERALSQTLAQFAMPMDFGQVAAWRLGVLDLFEAEIALADRPWYEVNRQVGKARPPRVDLLGGGAALQQSLLPAVQAAHAAHSRMITVTRCLRILNALTAAEAAGGAPSGLADLGLTTEVATDPFTGDPLVVERRDGGWWVYSVMTNQTDDGGKFDDTSDYGLKPYPKGDNEPRQP